MKHENATGRLVVIAERKLTKKSKEALHSLLEKLICESAEVTFVAGLTRAAMLSAGREGGRFFYNSAEHIPLCDMIGMVPWKEIWIVSNGNLWRGKRFQFASPAAGAINASAEPFPDEDGSTSSSSPMAE